MEAVIELDKFDGKRNTALTFVIPPNYDFKKDYNKIKKVHSAIKSTKRKGKLMAVTKEIDKNLESVEQFSGNGCIICCGLDKSSEPQYYQIESQAMLKDFEYYYGYGFETNRIKQLLFREYVKKIEQNEIKKTITEIENGFETGMSVVGTEIELAIKHSMISKIYYFSFNNIPWKLLKSSMDNNFEIVMMDMEDINNRDMARKYGEQIGYLYFKMDMDSLKVCQ